MSDETDFGEPSENGKGLLRWVIEEAISQIDNPDDEHGVGLMRAKVFDLETDAIVIGRPIEGGGWACSVVAMIVTEEMMEHVVMPGTYTYIPSGGGGQ